MAFPTISLTPTDSFNRVQNPIANGWTQHLIFGGGSLQTDGSVAKSAAAAGATGGAIYTATSYGPDAEAILTIPTIPAAGQPVRLWLRMTDASGTGNGYSVRVTPAAGAGNDVWGVYYVLGGISTLIGASLNTGPDIVAGDKMGMEVVGSTINVYRYDGANWTQLVSRADSQFSAGGFGAITVNDVTATVDDFTIGTSVAAAPNDAHGGLVPAGMFDPELVSGAWF
jgi:hypothetical protein